MKKIYAALILAAILALILVWYFRDRTAEEAERLATVLDLRPGRVVADIGAGDGRFSLAMARRVGASGRVIATELDAGELAKLRSKFGGREPGNVTVVEGAAAETNLPPECCDAILLRGVYHHFTRPDAMNASLLRSLKPGGRLAVVDFAPSTFLNLFFPIKDAPKRHGGHGVPRRVLIEELQRAGAQVDASIDDWYRGQYCVVFRR